jgi:hypothetical protein
MLLMPAHVYPDQDAVQGGMAGEAYEEWSWKMKRRGKRKRRRKRGTMNEKMLSQV